MEDNQEQIDRMIDGMIAYLDSDIANIDEELEKVKANIIQMKDLV